MKPLVFQEIVSAFEKKNILLKWVNSMIIDVNPLP
jgi:hypothetical protein